MFYPQEGGIFEDNTADRRDDSFTDNFSQKLVPGFSETLIFTLNKILMYLEALFMYLQNKGASESTRIRDKRFYIKVNVLQGMEMSNKAYKSC